MQGTQFVSIKILGNIDAELHHDEIFFSDIYCFSSVLLY